MGYNKNGKKVMLLMAFIIDVLYPVHLKGEYKDNLLSLLLAMLNKLI